MPQPTSKTKRPKTRDHLAPTPAGQWKRAGVIEDLELPSGNVARVKRPGPDKILTSGIMPDTLMPIVNAAIRSGKGLRPQDETDLLQDPSKIADVVDGIDRAMVHIIVQPPVVYHKREVDGSWIDIPDAERDEDAIYTDWVDFDDKMFIFNYAVGGTRDLERFRQEQEARMGNLADDASTGDSPE